MTPIPYTEDDLRGDQRLDLVKNFLANAHRPTDMSDRDFKKFVRFASGFFVAEGRLYRKNKLGHHQVIPTATARYELVRQAHDEMGHKGTYTVWTRLSERFWWPHMDRHIKWFVQTCHQCQTRSFRKQHIPPIVAEPAPLFKKAYVDTMLMPKAGGYRYIVQARCSLTSWPEWKALKQENGKTIGEFLFQEVLCRWGGLAEIVTDNGGPFVNALEYLSEKYHIRHIKISAYNSQANGPVERRHRDVREALMKTANGNEDKWPTVAHTVFWAERITIAASTGHSPYYMAHGVEPLLPFDISEATYLMGPWDTPMTEAELLAIRARQLEKRPEDLERVKDQIWEARRISAKRFERTFERSLVTQEHAPGALVLVRNSRINLELNRKTKARYIGPYVVIRKTKNGNYILAELDGTVSKMHYAAFRVVPYLARERVTVPLHIPEKGVDEGEQLTEDIIN